ncbi:MAG: hypothetical protein CMI53_03340 [Parcubacteria group bacterium]|nr:hypothetical protein [Parcubacteria group bacterium]|tara:strand:+ start:6830 stop:8395 length:1566 start_codon:yes stop_codon:yes gene_type:complete
MRFFITNPIGYYGEKHILSPIGMLSIATVAKQYGAEVKYMDAYLDNPSPEEFQGMVKDFKPDVIGISFNVEDRIAAFDTAKLAKAARPQSLVVLGGPFPTMVHRDIIDKLDYVDVAIRGEGEKTIVQLFEVLEGKRSMAEVKGITYRENGKTIINPAQDAVKDLNDLPMPDFSLANNHKYKSYIPQEEEYDDLDKMSIVRQNKTEKPMANLIFSRGCPFNCVFCSAEAMWTRTLRTLKVENCLKQVKYFLDQGITDFVFQDDHLIANKKWFHELADGLKNLDSRIRYACLARIDSVDDETAKKLYESGCRMITLGIENLSNNSLKLMKKKIGIDQTFKCLETLNRNKIIVRGGILISTPGETLDDVSENVRLHKKLRKYLIEAGGIGALRIYPGAELEKVAERRNQMNFSWVEPFEDKRNYLMSTPTHIPLFENIPHETVLPHLIKESLRYNDHYLSRVLIRQHIFRIGDPEKRSFFNKTNERLLASKGILVYLFSGSILKFAERIKFLFQVLTQKEARVT